MRILHTADLHLGRRPQGGRGNFSEKRYDDYFIAFDRITDLALRESVDCVTISGDILDSNAMLPETLARAEAILARLREANIPVIATWGNHDRPGFGGDKEFWLAFLENKGLLTMPRAERIRAEEGTTWNFRPICLREYRFWTSGFWGAENEAALYALAEHLAKCEKSAGEIVLVHSALGTGNEQLDFASIRPAVLQTLRENANIVFIGGGHFHTYSSWPADAPVFFVPGAPEYFDIAERARDKAVILFDTANGEHTRLPVSPRAKHDLEIHARESDTRLFIEHELDPLVRERGLAPEDLVSLVVYPPPGGYIDAELCIRWLEEERGALKAQVRVVCDAVRESDTSSEHYSGDTLADAALMEECILRHQEFLDKKDAALELVRGLWRDKTDFVQADDFLRQAHERLRKFFDDTKPVCTPDSGNAG